MKSSCCHAEIEELFKIDNEWVQKRVITTYDEVIILESGKDPVKVSKESITMQRADYKYCGE